MVEQEIWRNIFIPFMKTAKNINAKFEDTSAKFMLAIKILKQFFVKLNHIYYSCIFLQASKILNFKLSYLQTLCHEVEQPLLFLQNVWPVNSILEFFLGRIKAATPNENDFHCLNHYQVGTRSILAQNQKAFAKIFFVDVTHIPGVHLDLKKYK